MPNLETKMTDPRQEQIERNYEEFLKKLPELLVSHLGKFALMRNGEIIQYFDGMGDAAIAGSALYPDGLFSVQEITDNSVNLGYFSCLA